MCFPLWFVSRIHSNRVVHLFWRLNRLHTHTHTHTERSDQWETKLRYAPYFSVLLPEPWYITPDL